VKCYDACVNDGLERKKKNIVVDYFKISYRRLSGQILEHDLKYLSA